MIGQTLRHYRVEAMLGKGGRSVVCGRAGADKPA